MTAKTSDSPATDALIAWIGEHHPPWDPSEKMQFAALSAEAVADTDGELAGRAVALAELSRPATRPLLSRALIEDPRTSGRRTLLWWSLHQRATASLQQLAAAEENRWFAGYTEQIARSRHIAEALAKEADLELEAIGEPELRSALEAEDERLSHLASQQGDGSCRGSEPGESKQTNPADLVRGPRSELERVLPRIHARELRSEVEAWIADLNEVIAAS